MSGTLEIRLSKGPLHRERLAVIADLYGRADSKYASVDFCEHQFNHNPSGYSFHSFAHDGDRVVGVHNLIPIAGTARGELIRSAKAEAVFVDDDYRRSMIPEGDAMIPLFLATSRRLYQFGMEHGIQVIHMMGAAGLLFRFTGAKELKLDDVSSTFLLSGMPGSQLRTAATGALALGQRIIDTAAAAPAALAPRAQTVDAHAAGSAALESFVRARLRDTRRWSLDQNAANLAWYSGTGLLRVSTCERASALLRWNSGPGEGVEILAWSDVGSSFLERHALLHHIIGTARAAKAVRILVWESSLAARSRLSSLLAWFGFARVRRTRNFYVKADDPYFLKAENVEFTPFFWATF